MARIMKRKKKRCLEASDECLVKSDQLLQTTYSRWEKIIEKFPNRHCFISANQGRLAGGGNDVIEVTPERSETEELPLTPEEAGTILQQDGGDESASAPSTGNTLDQEKTVDEMIDYILHQLQEASRALESLTGSHENDLKLMLVEMVTKVFGWSSQVRGKIDEATKELDDLRRQLNLKNTELQELQAKFTECETLKAIYEKAVADSGIKITIGTDPSYSSVHLPQVQSQGQVEGQLSPRGIQAAQVLQPSAISPENLASQLQPDGSMLPPALASDEIHESLQGQPSVRHSEASILRNDVVEGQAGYSAVAGRSGIPGDVSGMATSAIPIEQLAQIGTDQVAITRETTQRECELEYELEQLRRENEKMLKERTEYENAIQQALLKGVSCLNVEALKVLKKPLLSCYLPCLPCNQSPECRATTSQSCPKPMEKEREKPSPLSRHDLLYRQKREEKSSRCLKKLAQSACYSSDVQEKPSNMSRVFLLPQPSRETTAFPRCSARPISAGSKSIGLDGKYGRTMSTRENTPCSMKAPRITYQDFCQASRRGYSHPLNCIDIFSTNATRYDVQDIKRCDPCNRIRQLFKD